jgi:hypothetical protein
MSEVDTPPPKTDEETRLEHLKTTEEQWRSQNPNELEKLNRVSYRRIGALAIVADDVTDKVFAKLTDMHEQSPLPALLVAGAKTAIDSDKIDLSELVTGAIINSHLWRDVGFSTGTIVISGRVIVERCQIGNSTLTDVFAQNSSIKESVVSQCKKIEDSSIYFSNLRETSVRNGSVESVSGSAGQLVTGDLHNCHIAYTNNGQVLISPKR